MGRPRQQTSLPNTKSRIMDAALHLFAERGDGVPLADIAARAGITRPSLLHHFASKEALLAEVLQTVFGAFQAMLDDAAREAAGPHALAARFVSLLQEQPAVARLLLRELCGDGQASAVVAAMTEPLLQQAEAALSAQSSPAQVRAAMMQGIVSTLLWCSAGSDVRALWGAPDAGPRYIPTLFAMGVGA
jgi:AcrR family transcriptional regulator